MKKFLLTFIVAAVSLSALSASGTAESQEPMMEKDTMMDKDPMMSKTDTMMETPVFDIAGLGPKVVAFEGEAQTKKLLETQSVVYFFAASWCPACKGTFKDISMNVSMIPKELTIVLVNYDKAADLKKKYGVTYQHTFVWVDENLNSKKTWSGSESLKAIVSNLTM